MLNSRVQSVCNEACNVLARLFPSTRWAVAVPDRRQRRILRHRHRVLNLRLPARRERMIQPQIQLMGLVNRILTAVLPLLIIIQPVSVTQPDFRLLQRHVQAERGIDLKSDAALFGGAVV